MKPLSKRIKYEFAQFDATKKMLIGIGQRNHTVTSYMTIWSSGYKVKSIKPLDEDRAMKDGAEFVGEAFVLTVSASIVIWEYSRSAEKQVKKAEQKRQQIRKEQKLLQSKLCALDIRIKAIEDLIKQQQNLDERGLLGRVTTKPKYVAPPKEGLVPISEENVVDLDYVESSEQSLEVKQQKSWWKF